MNNREYHESLKYRYIESLSENLDIYTEEEHSIRSHIGDGYRFGPLAIKQLKDCIKKLTPRQQQIINLILEGKTQNQVAAELGIKQTTVSLSLTGIRKNGEIKGGIYKKLRRLFGY